MKNFYRYKARYSRIITDFTPSELSGLLELGQFALLDYRNTDDSVVGVLRIGHFDTNRFTAHEVMSLTYAVGEFCFESEVSQVAGYSVVLDLAGFSLRMAAHYARPTILYRLVTGIQDCAPARIKAFHIVNEPLYTSAAFAIVKGLLNEKLKKRVHFHGADMESLHKHIPSDILPKELGGTNQSIRNIAKCWVPLMLEKESHFARIKAFGYVGETLKRLQAEVSESERR